MQYSNIGTLFLVSTPIGNLEDITFRAINILKSVDLIAAEDTRRSKILLSKYEIDTKMISYFDHNKFQRLQQIEKILKNNKDIAVITDAGTPAISDPAYKLIRKAIEIGCKVEPVPGASAVLTALVSSGLPTDRFLFEGFLPPKKGRKKRIESFKNIEATIIIYENNLRLKSTVNQLLEVLGDRPAVLCRELTKVYEEIIRGTLSSLSDILENKTFKGECVLLLSKDDQNIYFD